MKVVTKLPEEPTEPLPAQAVAVGERVVKVSRRERRKLATREALLKAAQEVIAVKGVYLAVIEEITERADVAKGLFYQYFKDRDDLLHVILNRRLGELRAQIESAPSPRSFPDRARMLLRCHLDYFLLHEDFLLFLHQIRGLIKMKGSQTPAVRDTYQQYLLFLTAWLQPQDARTRVNGSTREENACALLGFLTGFLSHYAILAPLADLTRDKTRIEASLTAACAAFWQH